MFPNPATSPAVKVLQARSKLATRAEEEFEAAARSKRSGREFLDVIILRQILMLRDDQKVEASKIEQRLGLKKGVVQRLGRGGVVGATSL